MTNTPYAACAIRMSLQCFSFHLYLFCFLVQSILFHANHVTSAMHVGCELKRMRKAVLAEPHAQTYSHAAHHTCVQTAWLMQWELQMA